MLRLYFDVEIIHPLIKTTIIQHMNLGFFTFVN